ncbi:MAG: O-antigen ligase family protein [Oscillospiraceae bacterium]|nr:O-antigen ligase family protein [Oscillospiraceae bacterium]
MITRALRGSVILRSLARFLRLSLAQARQSALFGLLRGSFVLGFACARLPAVFSLVTAALFVIPGPVFDNLYSLYAMTALTALALLGGYFTPAANSRGINKPRFSAIGGSGIYALLFLAVVLFSVVASPLPLVSFRSLLFLLTAFMACALAYFVLRSRRDLRLFVVILLAAVTVSGLYACYQAYVGLDVSSRQTDLSQNPDMPGRVYSFFTNPNNYAMMLVMVLPLYAAVFFESKSGLARRAAALCFLPPALALLLTFSRAGWASFAVGVLVFLFFTHRRVIPYLFAAALITLPLLPSSIHTRLFSLFGIFTSSDSSASHRAYIYNLVFPVLEKHWLFGTGLGTESLRYAIMRYYATLPEFTSFEWGVPPHTHNIYLQVWLETGIAGVASFCGAAAALLRRCADTLRRRRDYMLTAGFACIVSSLFFGFFDYIWFYPRTMLLFWLVTGVTLRALRPDEAQAANSA